MELFRFTLWVLGTPLENYSANFTSVFDLKIRCDQRLTTVHMLSLYQMNLSFDRETSYSLADWSIMANGTVVLRLFVLNALPIIHLCLCHVFQWVMTISSRTDRSKKAAGGGLLPFLLRSIQNEYAWLDGN